MKFQGANSDYKISHFCIVEGLNPAAPEPEPEPEEPEKHSDSDLEKKVADTESVTADTAWSDGITAGAEDTVTFKLSSTIPEYLANEDAYAITFHDVMDTKLSLNTNSFTVFIDKNQNNVYDEGTDTALTNETNYTFNNSSISDGCTFEITMNLRNLYNASNGPITSSDLGKNKIVVLYTATLAEDITAGCYENEAWVHYSDKDTTHDKVTVDTYGIKIVKYDASTATYDENSNTLTAKDDQEIKYLADAVFELYPSNEDGTINESAGAIRTGITTGEDGKISIDGLAEGTYYLKETDAPDGYVEPTNPIKVVVSLGTDSKEYYVTAYIPNTETGQTGGAGTMFYTFGGLAIVAAAGIVLLASRKSRKQSA